MTVKPLVSICIPSFNSEKWIKATIESALDQTWQNKEIIIVDDGSTDNTPTIIKSFKYKNVKIIFQNNSGACAARNKAYSIAQGDFIQWLDADDILAPNKIEIQLNSSDMDSESKILHSSAWGFFYYCLTRAKMVQTPLWNDLTNKDWLLNHFNGGFMIPNHSWLVSRRLCELAGPWNEALKINQDGEYFCRVVRSSDFVKFHSDALCYYRKGTANSISRTNRSLQELSYSNNLCINHLLEFSDDGDTRKASINFLQSFISKFYVDNSDIIRVNQNRIIELGGKVKKVDESLKFYFLRKITGRKIARDLKSKVWYFRINIEKWLDKFFYTIGYR
jgi:glycosyltransferase involved in cell wall biosynthesis